MAATRLASKPVRPGDLVLVKYRDHLLFRHSDASKQTPRVLTAVGRLTCENEDFVTIAWEDYTDPGESLVKSTGLCIIRSTIVELGRLLDG